MKKKVFLISAIAIGVVVLGLNGCKQDKKTVEDNYSGIKSSNWRSNIGDTFEVDGYYDEVNGIGKIINKPEHHSIDAAIPEPNYILIAKPTGLTHVPDYTPLIGRKVRIKGSLQPAVEPSLVGSAGLLGDISLATLKVAKVQLIDSVSYFAPPIRINFCERYPAICDMIINPFPTKVAFLYSGGINAGNAHQRYYNDIKTMYWILRNKFGYSDQNIVVCYKNGAHDYAAPDTFKIDYPASKAGFDAAIADLKARMGVEHNFSVLSIIMVADFLLLKM